MFTLFVRTEKFPLLPTVIAVPDAPEDYYIDGFDQRCEVPADIFERQRKRKFQTGIVNLATIRPKPNLVVPRIEDRGVTWKHPEVNACAFTSDEMAV